MMNSMMMIRHSDRISVARKLCLAMGSMFDLFVHLNTPLFGGKW